MSKNIYKIKKYIDDGINIKELPKEIQTAIKEISALSERFTAEHDTAIKWDSELILNYKLLLIDALPEESTIKQNYKSEIEKKELQKQTQEKLDSIMEMQNSITEKDNLIKEQENNINEQRSIIEKQSKTHQEIELKKQRENELIEKISKYEFVTIDNLKEIGVPDKLYRYGRDNNKIVNSFSFLGFYFRGTNPFKIGFSVIKPVNNKTENADNIQADNENNNNEVVKN